MSKWANYYTKKVQRSDIVQRLGQLVTRATHKKNIHTQNNLKKQLTFRSH